MKLKLIIISIILIIVIILGGIFYFNKTSDANYVENTTNDEILENENIIDNSINNEIIDTQIVEEVQNEVGDIVVEETKQVETPNQVSSTQSQTTSQTTELKNNQQTKQEVQTTPVVETPKEEPKASTEPTPSDLGYWCIAGGSHHIEGDAPNEHGYYSTWNEANQAFESYTVGWASVQYKINQCGCGLFYFWAIQ